MTNHQKQLDEAVSFIKNEININAETAVILGSGLGNFKDVLTNTFSIPSNSIPHYPKSTVEGHEGNFIVAYIDSIPIIAIQGRSHFYEGYSLNEVVFSIRILTLLGIKNLIVSNASGALNPTFKPGDLMVITDQINFSFQNPLIGLNLNKIGDRFPDMSEPFSPKLINLVKKIGISERIQLQTGTYLGLTGPSYETPAEVRMLRKFGADAVGMSTVPDVIAAKHANMNIIGISCITNAATGTSSEKLSHNDVTKVAGENSQQFNRLISKLIKSID